MIVMTFAIETDYAADAPGLVVLPPCVDVAAELEALERELTSLAGHLNAGNYRFLVLLAEFDRRGGHVGIGIASCAHWLSWRCGIGLIAAREKVRVARALEQLPKLADAMRRGVLSYCKVRALTRVATPENEAVLLSIAEQGTVSHVEKLVRVYRRVQRADERDAANARYADRYLQAFVDVDGTVVIKARLAPEQGSQFMTALRAACTVLSDAERDSRESFPTPDVPLDKSGARNADAIALMAETFLTGGASPASGPDRQLINIHVDESVLHDETAEGRCLIDDQVSIPPETARRIACDASLVTIVDDANGDPLDVGRKTRSIPTALRRALKARDSACQFPGCTNSRFVDAHHIKHWADGGETSLSNLVLLCRRHHRFVHEYGYTIERSSAGFDFMRPDGRVVRSAPPLNGVDAAQGQRKLCESNEQARVEITPATADAHWSGESLDYDWVLRRLFELDEQASQEADSESRSREMD
jgi:hypothetical protein